MVSSAQFLRILFMLLSLVSKMSENSEGQNMPVTVYLVWQFQGLFMTLFPSLLFNVEMSRFNTLQRDKSLWMGIQRSCQDLRSLIPMKSIFSI